MRRKLVVFVIVAGLVLAGVVVSHAELPWQILVPGSAGDKATEKFIDDNARKALGDDYKSQGSQTTESGSTAGSVSNNPSSSPGTPVAVQGKVCPTCGKSWPGTMRFCPEDGTQLAVSSARSSTGLGRTDPVTGMELVWVDGGCFSMGSNKGEEDERPVHEVCVDGFWIGKYEVTQAQWSAVMGSNPSKFKDSNRPVESVSWDDAQEFIARLNKAAGLHYRLPYEAEWEFAARGGTRSRGLEYSGSGIINEVAWYSENSGGATVPVGQKNANELGIYDMSGNVWEWCMDYYDKNYYRWSPKDNPKGPDGGRGRVLRGGSWDSNPSSARVAARLWSVPTNRYYGSGFRLVRDAP